MAVIINYDLPILIEEHICKLWCKYLSIENISPVEDILDAGATSFMIAQLSSELLDRFGVEVSMEEIYAGKTIKSTAALVLREAYFTVQNSESSDELRLTGSVEYWLDTLTRHDFSQKYNLAKNISRELNVGLVEYSHDRVSFDGIVEGLVFLAKVLMLYTARTSFLFSVDLPVAANGGAETREVVVPIDINTGLAEREAFETAKTQLIASMLWQHDSGAKILAEVQKSRANSPGRPDFHISLSECIDTHQARIGCITLKDRQIKLSVSALPDISDPAASLVAITFYSLITNVDTKDYKETYLMLAHRITSIESEVLEYNIGSDVASEKVGKKLKAAYSELTEPLSYTGQLFVLGDKNEPLPLGSTGSVFAEVDPRNISLDNGKEGLTTLCDVPGSLDTIFLWPLNRYGRRVPQGIQDEVNEENTHDGFETILI